MIPADPHRQAAPDAGERAAAMVLHLVSGSPGDGRADPDGYRDLPDAYDEQGDGLPTPEEPAAVGRLLGQPVRQILARI
ncbi:hypothetical protein BFF78_17065 [Streptomyces fodineus]|uniref:Uncharacterized protein n=1 Tax=Streptomyces fodineus TaxID=1904616 RepID=A0A1D7YAL2_9ACTN|nr:hypothetical protein [Streptomyces fodineus]AOR32544.1 hypothetical protein BFF78_17065 [Streptomyces fodineus]